MSALRLDGFHLEQNDGAGTTAPFMVSVVVAEPTEVHTVHDAAIADGAREVSAPRKGFFGGFSGVHVRSDGAVVKPSSARRKDRGTPRSVPEPDETVVVLGVDEPEEVRDFYVALGMVTDRDYGRKFVDFTLSDAGIRLGMLTPNAIMKDTGVSSDELADVPLLVLEHHALDATEMDDLVTRFVAAGGSRQDGLLTVPAGHRWTIAFPS